MEVIFEKILLLGLIMLLGFFAEKTGYIKGLRSHISQLLTKITLPLLVITTLSGQTKNAETQNTALAIFILGILFVCLLLLVGKLSALPFSFDKKRRDAHMCLTAFGNTIFLGYPLLQALWGPQAVFYAAFFSIANDLAAWTLGVLIMSRTKNGKPNFQKLLNPTTLSYVVGALLFIFSIRLPAPIFEAASMVGSTTTVLSMLFLGAALASVRFKALLSGLSAVTIVVLKMILVPIGAYYFLSWLLPALEIPIDMLAIPILSLELAMPCQSVFAVLAQEYGGDTSYVATTICLTTAVSLVTLPFIYTFLI